MITNANFINNLWKARFAQEYYAYCVEFQSSLPFTRLRARQADIMECLVRLGYALPKSKVDGSYVGRELNGGRQFRYGFAIQSTGSFECFFSWQQTNSEFIGGNYCVLAEQVQIHAGLPTVNPPYPRPDYCGPDRLFDLLSGWHQLHHKLRVAAGLEETAPDRLHT
jgi:hypothetical protein